MAAVRFVLEEVANLSIAGSQDQGHTAGSARAMRRLMWKKNQISVSLRLCGKSTSVVSLSPLCLTVPAPA